MRGRLLSAVAGLLLFPAFLPDPTEGQARDLRPRVDYASGEHPVSPTVWTSWIAETEGGIPREVVLVILWRGAPRWYSQVHGGTSIVPPAGMASAPLESSFRFGDAEVSFSFTPSTRTVRLLGREIPLGEDNVILVDRVGLPDVPPRIAGRARIASQLAPSDPDPRASPHQRITEILRRSPEVQAFLR